MERKLSYRDFSRKVIKRVADFYGERADVEIRKVKKNNGIEFDGVSVSFYDKAVSPAIYMEDLYGEYKKSGDLDAVIDEVIDMNERSQSQAPFDPEGIKDFDDVTNMLGFRLINYEKNEEMLREMPHRRVLDLALVYMCVFRNTDYGNASMLINDSLMSLWGIDRGELEIMARESAPEVLPESVRDMSEVLLGMFQDLTLPQAPPMKVISNSLGLYGASAICYEGLLDRVADELDDDLILLPSSVHEMLAIPRTGASSAQELRELVRSVNLTQVKLMEFLSDNVYLYARKTGKMEILS